MAHDERAASKNLEVITGVIIEIFDLDARSRGGLGCAHRHPPHTWRMMMMLIKKQTVCWSVIM